MVDAYVIALIVVGLAIFGAVLLPRLLMHQPLSLPIIYVGGGFLIFALPTALRRQTWLGTLLSSND